MLSDGITPASGWYGAGSVIEILAIPTAGYTFECWTGDLFSSKNPLLLMMDSPESITAHFSPKPPPVSEFTFDSGPDGWTFAGQVPPFDTPNSLAIPGYIGLNPGGSTNCFSYWYSPDVIIKDRTLYRTAWTVQSTAAEQADTVQFRMRVNQKGAWCAWDMIINSNLSHTPSFSSPKTYELFFKPSVTSSADSLASFSFDILSFDWNDDANSSLFLDSFLLEEH